MGGQPVLKLLRFPLQSFQLAGFSLSLPLFRRRRISLPVARQHLLGSLFHLLGLALVVAAGTALRLTGVGRELDAIDGKHLPANQALPITDHQHLGEQLRHFMP